MLTELRIQNFKAWRDTGAVRLAPLTVIFGTNSSGKSSLGHLLMALKQTAQLAESVACESSHPLPPLPKA